MLKMRHSREVLEEDSSWREWHLGFILLLLPVQDVLDVVLFCVKAITVTDRCFQQDTDGQRQLVCTQQTETGVSFPSINNV